MTPLKWTIETNDNMSEWFNSNYGKIMCDQNHTWASYHRKQWGCHLCDKFHWKLMLFIKQKENTAIFYDTMDVNPLFWNIHLITDNLVLICFKDQWCLTDVIAESLDLWQHYSHDSMSFQEGVMNFRVFRHSMFI